MLVEPILEYLVYVEDREGKQNNHHKEKPLPMKIPVFLVKEDIVESLV